MPGKNSADGRAVHALAFSAWFSATMPTMKRIQAFKFRLVPTPEQERLLSRHAGCVRFVWNKALVPLFPRRQADETGRTPGPGRSPEHEPDLLRLRPCVGGEPAGSGHLPGSSSAIIATTPMSMRPRTYSERGTPVAPVRRSNPASSSPDRSGRRIHPRVRPGRWQEGIPFLHGGADVKESGTKNERSDDGSGYPFF